MDITLALGGGGAKGNAHLGVLRRLEKEGYRICAVAGTSFGGLVALVYASGYAPEEIEKIFAAVDQKRLYARDAEDGPSLLGLSGVRKWLIEVLGDKTFDDLKIPCAVTSVDVRSGREVILTEGRLKDAILATIAIPGIFPPYPLNGWQLVDGGVLNPVPVSVARTLAPGLPVVAVVLNDPLDKPLRTYSIPVPSILPRSIVERISRMNFAQTFDIFMRAVDLSSRSVAHYRLQLDAPEVIVRPHVHHLEVLDRVDVHEIAQLGEDALEEVLPDLAACNFLGQQAGQEVLWGEALSRDIRKYAQDTNVRLIAGAIVVLLIVGLGLIWWAYEIGGAVLGLLCMLGALVPVGLIVLLLNLSDWILKRAGRE